jgi:23S rRNA (adenine-N6)-dimethyltransferase
LRRRLPEVDVLGADVLAMPWPREEFKVVANPPFDGATALLRRLLDPRVQLMSADLIVQWGLACKRASVWPSTQLGVYWGAWFELAVSRRLPRCVFAPPPRVDAGVLRVDRRKIPLVSVGQRRAYRDFLQRGYRHGVRAVVPWRLLKQSQSELGLDRHAQPRDLDAWQWAGLYSRTVRPAR